MNRLRLHVIACPVFQRELEMLAAGAKTEALSGTWKWDSTKIPLKISAPRFKARLMEWPPVNVMPLPLVTGFAIAALWGCRRGRCPLSSPRAHDCIGMLLGSSRCYLAQLKVQPGTYFQSAGWLENSPASGEIRQQNFTFGPNSNVTRGQLVEKYGEENADYLLEQFNNLTRHYERLAFIATPVPEAAKWEKAARETARAHGWKFEKLPGDLGWLRRLLNADWNDREFLKLKPGERVALRHNAQLITAEPA
jgi:hypothetical protein